MDYSELQQEIVDWLDRPDASAKVPEFIKLTERRCNRLLRTGDQSQSITIPGDGGNSYGIPQPYKGLRVVYVDGEPIAYLTPDALSQLAVSDRLSFYTITGPNQQADRWHTITFSAAVPDTSTIELQAYRQVTELDDTDTENWLLKDHEDAYLYGSLREGFNYVKDYPAAGLYDAQFLDVMEQIIQRDRLDRWSGAPLVIRSDTAPGNRARRSGTLRRL